MLGYGKILGVTYDWQDVLAVKVKIIVPGVFFKLHLRLANVLDVGFVNI